MKIFSLSCLTFLTAASCSNFATPVTGDSQIKPRSAQTNACLSQDEIAMKLDAITESSAQKADEIKESLLIESRIFSL